MIDVFAAAASDVLAVLGQQATLRSVAAGQVHLEKGVYVSLDGAAVVHRDVATILTRYAPRSGDELVHPDGVYRLDVLYQDSGVTQRWILRPVVNGGGA